MKIIIWIRRFSERFHIYIHLLVGLLSVWQTSRFLDTVVDWNWMLAGLLGAVLPDIDHLMFIFGYGRKSEYAKVSKAYMRLWKWNDLIVYWKKNHKSNTNIVSHNILSLALFYGLYKLFVGRSHYAIGVLFVSMGNHFIFDLIEDLLFMGRFNRNWWLRFGRD